MGEWTNEGTNASEDYCQSQDEEASTEVEREGSEGPSPSYEEDGEDSQCQEPEEAMQHRRYGKYIPNIGNLLHRVQRMVVKASADVQWSSILSNTLGLLIRLKGKLDLWREEFSGLIYDTGRKIWRAVRWFGPYFGLLVFLFLMLSCVLIAVELVTLWVTTLWCSVPGISLVADSNSICPPSNGLLLSAICAWYDMPDLTMCQSKAKPLILPTDSAPNSFLPLSDSIVNNNEKLAFLRQQATYLSPITNDMVRWDVALLQLDLAVHLSKIPGAETIQQSIQELRALGAEIAPKLDDFNLSVEQFDKIQVYKTKSTIKQLRQVGATSWYTAILKPLRAFFKMLVRQASRWLPLRPEQVSGLEVRLDQGRLDFSIVPIVIKSHVDFLNGDLSRMSLLGQEIERNFATQLHIIDAMLRVISTDQGDVADTLAVLQNRRQWLSGLLSLCFWNGSHDEQAKLRQQMTALDHFHLSTITARVGIGDMHSNITSMQKQNQYLMDWTFQMAKISGEMECEEEDGPRGVQRQGLRRDDLLLALQQIAASTAKLQAQNERMTRVKVVDEVAGGNEERAGGREVNERE